MALKRNERYPGRFSNPTTAHPQGAFKNRTAPNSQDGSYLEQDWANDWDGFFSSLLSAAGVTPNGIVDAVGSSQYYNALSAAMTGRLIGTPKIFTAAATYTPSAGTKNIIIEAVSGGGGGGGVVNISAGQSAIGGGGQSGEYVRTPLIAASTLSLTVGNGGAGGVGNNPGNSGGATTVGSIISLRGGPGGGSGGATTANMVSSTAGSLTGTLNYPANSIYMGISLGPRGYVVNPGVLTGALPGSGGSTPLGVGGIASNISSDGAAATGYGAGGAGALNIANNPARNGGNGSGGVVIIWEYA